MPWDITIPISSLELVCARLKQDFVIDHGHNPFCPSKETQDIYRCLNLALD